MEFNKFFFFFLALITSLFFYGLLWFNYKKMSPKVTVVVATLGFISSLIMGSIGLFYK